MNSSESFNPSTASSLKVVQLVPRLHVGGVERGVVEFAEFLLQQGHQPVVISAGGALVAHLEAAGITHIQLDVASKSPRLFFQIRTLRRILRELQPDVVHARSRIPAWMSRLALRRMNPRPLFVTTLHGLHSVNRYSAVMASSDQVIAVSQTASRYLTEHYRRYLHREPVVIYRGISEAFTAQHRIPDQWHEQWRLQHPELTGLQKVLLPGRLSRLKGFESLIPWLQVMPENTRLLLTARPDESAYASGLNQQLNELGLADRVVWLGIQRDMPSIYQSVDLVVSVNRKPESFGRTVLEALSMGVPVVAYALGGVQEVMSELFPDGLVEAGDTAGLSDKINAMLLDKPVLNTQHNFTNQNMFTQTVSLYQQLLGERHG